tara:strand:- start:386 stop:769 length:384 start_codon:yes stop_codon:yes gene_type:complete
MKHRFWRRWVYVSPGASRALREAVAANRHEVHICIIEQGRVADSCDANAAAWTRVLRRDGWDAVHVLDGVAVLAAPIWSEDAEEEVDHIGHDWTEVRDRDRRTVIVDGAIAQFDGQIPSYIGGDRRR